MTKKTKPLLTAASIGRQYVRLDGGISEPLRPSVEVFGADYWNKATHPYACYRWSYNADGVISDIGERDESDLVRLATPAEIAAGHALPVKERKAKEGRRQVIWCFESSTPEMGLMLTVKLTRKRARDCRRNDRELGAKCGPIFGQTITCPAWSPK